MTGRQLTIRERHEPARYGEALYRLSADAFPGPMADTGVVDQIQEIVALVDDVLGPDVIGTYLHGSSVLGGLKPASDLDVFVVSCRSLVNQEREALLDGLFKISGFTA